MLVTEDGFTDELLRQHTEEAENLSTKFETMKHILEVGSLTFPLLSFRSSGVTIMLAHARNHPPFMLRNAVFYVMFFTLRRKSKNARLSSSREPITRQARRTPAVSWRRVACKSEGNSKRGEANVRLLTSHLELRWRGSTARSV